MRFLSVCSGIEAASVAWKPLGWRCVGVSEIEPFPCAVLAHHYPDVPNFGDMTQHANWPDGLEFDVLCGGTPCQGFSVAGKRGGMDDPRSRLAIDFVEIAARHRPKWVVWENVPGVFSSGGGEDFAGFLGMLAGRRIAVPAGGWKGAGCVEGIPDAYGVAWRVLDAQYFGVAQRRRRVFVVGCLGDWRGAAAVLFEPEGLRGDPAPRRTKGQGFAHDTSPCLGASGRGFDRAGETRGQDPVVAVDITNTNICGDKANCIEAAQDKDNRGQGVLAVRQVEFGEYADDGTASTVKARDGKCATDLVAFSCKDHGADAAADQSPTLRAMGHDGSRANGGGQVAVAIQERAVSENPNAGPGGKGWKVDQAFTLEARQVPQAVAFQQNQVGEVRTGDIAGTMNTNGNATGRNSPLVAFKQETRNLEPETNFAVRRLTPRECERLQGFPDDYTAIPWRGKGPEDCPDGPRYKALGNSWAVPCARWIGERIEAVHRLMGFRESEAGEKSFPKVGRDQHETEMVTV